MKKIIYILSALLFFSACQPNAKQAPSSVASVKDTLSDSASTKKKTYSLVTIQRANGKSVQPGAPKPLNVKSPLIVPTNTNVHPLLPPTTVPLPEKLIVNTPGKDTFKLPAKVAAKGLEVPCKQPAPVVAAPPRFKDATICNLQYLDVDQGMSAPSLRSILTDKDGNIWFGTNGAGVSRYDGRSFWHYTEKEGLSGNTVLSMIQDRDGNFWFGTEGSGVTKYDGKTFTWFGQDEGLTNSTVLAIMQDRKGRIWFGTNGGGACCYDGKEFTVYDESNGLCNNSVRVIIEDKSGNMWFGTNGSGASRFDGTSFTTFSENEGLGNNVVLAMFEDRDGNIWFGTDAGGADLFNGKTFTHYTEKEGLSNNSVLSIMQDHSGVMWFGTYNGGANEFDGKSFTHFTEKEGLSNNYVVAMAEDKAGNIWFATYGAGVNRYDKYSFTHYTIREGLGSNTVRSIVQDQKGNLWFGTYGDGLIGYDGKTFTHYSEKEGLPSGFFKAVLSDRNGNLWIGTDGSGVLKYDGRTFVNYTSDQGLCGDYILALYEDNAGNIWFGSDGEGVSRYDGKTFTNYNEEGGLCYNTVQVIAQDKKGKMWFGTDGGGACSFDGEFFKYYSEKQGLSSDYVRSIVEDHEGNIWFGTDGMGLCMLQKNSLSGRNAKFTRFTVQDGLSNNIIRSILEDQKTGNLWVATEKGLDFLDLHPKSPSATKVQVHVFTSANGLKANNFMNNSALIDRLGNAWWGNGKALSTLDLNTFKIFEGIPHLLLNAVDLEQTYIDFHALADSLKSGNPMLVGVTKKSLAHVKFSSVAQFYNYPENLELPYNINHLTFHFSALEWSAPDKIRYQYMLQGSDKDWSPATTDNKALYSNLAAGDYVFMVRAMGLSQKWSEVIEYKFTIYPPWWKTWWAYILYIALSAALLYIIFRWRTAQLRERQKQLEQTVAERTAEVVEQKELIEEKQKEIVDSINYAKRIQRALLASDQMLDSNLKDYFLYFQPKDIVSGDFYWASHDANDNFVLVTADSTGHGVPGAMMCMLNISCLNEAINERKYTNPAKILNHVRERIIQSLARDGSVEGGKDGMDCSVAVFDFKNRKLTYAAANNPIWIVRKNAEGLMELIDLKADRMPVGKHDKDSVSFSDHTVDLQAGDMIYTMTDGFADQFGGEKGKKFTNKRLKDLLSHNAARPLAEQREALTKAMDRWKFGVEQIDDICVIGVRVN